VNSGLRLSWLPPKDLFSEAYRNSALGRNGLKRYDLNPHAAEIINPRA
jgi:hypothetical protein